MRVFVSNSGPIISFARAGYLELLEKAIGELWIPEAVYKEIVVKGKGRPGSDKVRQAKWLKSKKIGNKGRSGLFPHDLGLGEIEAIMLADELKAVLIIDDKRARQEAESRGIETIGSLKIIKEAKDKGLIEKAKPLLDALRRESLRIRDDLYREFLEEIREG
ncbi:MAG: DUF3368 domain-containing protein [Deltaproteobacteria bacterium]|nr:DUF3368 domain-containing protein [Deltaproteobacteria bacterium]